MVFDEVISLLWKVPASKRNLRTYHIQGDEGHHIQMISALLMQLVQSSTVLPRAHLCPTEAERAKASALVYESAMHFSTHFWRSVVQKWNTFKGQEAGDMRAIMDNLVADLLTSLNAPEFPGAGLLLQVTRTLL
jgi:cohesin loading factor subunit SCC2